MINFPDVAVNLKNLPSDEVAVLLQDYSDAKSADSENRKRLVENIKFTGGLPDDQYPDMDAQDLDRQGRDRQQYNLVQYFVNGTTGNMIMNGIDPKFVEPQDDSTKIKAVQKLQQVYYADKNKFNYKHVAQQCIRNGAISRGVEELVIDRRFDPRGRLRFVNHNPTHITFEQTTNDDITRSVKRAWKEVYLSAAEMAMFYPNMAGDIKKAIKKLAKSDSQGIVKNERQDIAEYVIRPKGRKGDKYLCVEFNEIKYETQQVTIDVKTGTTLPRTPFESGSLEEILTMQSWAQQKGLSISAATITKWDKIVPVMYTTTFCMDLAVVLENRKDERQLDGNLPYYVWSFILLNGKTIGIADLAKEAQKDFNAREMQKTKEFTQTMRQKGWVHASQFGDQANKKQDEFVANFNDSSKVEVIPDEIPLGVVPFGVIKGVDPSQAYFQDESFKLNLLNLICFLPPVLQGMSKGGDSGVLFGRKVIEATTVLQMPAKNIELHENYKASDWKLMAVQLYGGRTTEEKIANINRTFSEGLPAPVTVNQHVGNDLETGQPIIEDGLSTLDGVEVLVTQAKENDYIKQAKRELNINAMQAIPPTPTNDMTRALYETNLAKSMDYVDDEEKKQADQVCKLRLDIAIKQGQVLLKQLDMQLNPPAMPIAPGMPQGPQPGTAPGMPQPQLQPAVPQSKAA